MYQREILLAAALVATPFQAAAALNTPSVSASVSGYTAIDIGVIPQSQWVPITVTRNDGPLHAEASGSGGRFFTECTVPCSYGPALVSASATGFASADPGVLRIYGSDLAIAQTLLNGPNIPGTPNSNTVYTNIQVGASFTDYLTVTSPSLAVGTPVQVPFNYLVEVVSDTVLGYPVYSQRPIDVSASFNITGLGPQNFSSGAGLNFFRGQALPNGNALYTIRSREGFPVDARVGDVLTISAAFAIYGQANITDLNREQQYGAFADGRNTAALWLGTLPGDLVITSASGHDYTIDPTAAAIPEPQSYMMMLAGLGVLGLVARRYKHQGTI